MLGEKELVKEMSAKDFVNSFFKNDYNTWSEEYSQAAQRVADTEGEDLDGKHYEDPSVNSLIDGLAQVIVEKVKKFPDRKSDIMDYIKNTDTDPATEGQLDSQGWEETPELLAQLEGLVEEKLAVEGK